VKQELGLFCLNYYNKGLESYLASEFCATGMELVHNTTQVSFLFVVVVVVKQKCRDQLCFLSLLNLCVFSGSVPSFPFPFSLMI
jgi:hypothetical protein